MPAVCPFFRISNQTQNLTMKTNRTILIALAAVVSSAGLIALNHYQPATGSQAESPAKATRAEVRPTRTTDSASNSSAASSRRTTGAVARSEGQIPEGVDPEAWKQASAMMGIVTVLGSLKDLPGVQDNNPEAAEVSNLMKDLGLNESTAQSIDKLIAERGEKKKEALNATMQAFQDHCPELTEAFALTIMQGKAPLTEAQTARMAELKQVQESEMPQQPTGAWQDDEDLLASMRSQMSGSQAEGLDSYLADRKRKAADALAFNSTQTLSSMVNLDSDQTAAALDLYRENAQPSDEQITALLSDSQKAAYQKEKDRQKDLQAQISAKLGIFGGLSK